jgi:hypothetical protein
MDDLSWLRKPLSAEADPQAVAAFLVASLPWLAPRTEKETKFGSSAMHPHCPHQGFEVFRRDAMTCPDCGRVCGSPAGLGAHRAAHRRRLARTEKETK